MSTSILWFSFFFFFNDTATTEIYTLSLHDALPICDHAHPCGAGMSQKLALTAVVADDGPGEDRKSTRLNSSHSQISYAVFCLKKKNKQHNTRDHNQYKHLPQRITLSSIYHSLMLLR